MSEELRRYRSKQASAARYQGLADRYAPLMADANRYQVQADAYKPPFDPLAVDWKAEGAGSRKSPFNPKTYDWEAEGAGSRPSGVDVEALRRIQLGDDGNEPPPDDKPKPPADDKPNDYSEEGSALSAEVFGALAQRRRTVDEQLQKAMEQERFQTQRLQLAAQTARTQVAREFRNLAEDLQMKLGGRGLATDPRFAGRGRRRLQMQQDEKFGEISQTLSDEISALQEMVQTVSDARDREMAKIAQDEALARTMPAALFPAALQYTSS